MDQPNEAVTTEEEFNETLGELVRTAYENDVDIEGGWECRNGADDPDWDIVILEVTKKVSSDDE